MHEWRQSESCAATLARWAKGSKGPSSSTRSELAQRMLRRIRGPQRALVPNVAIFMNVWIGMPPRLRTAAITSVCRTTGRLSKQSLEKQKGRSAGSAPTDFGGKSYSNVTRLASIPARNEPSINGAIDSAVGGSPSMEPRPMIHSPSSTINSSIS